MTDAAAESATESTKVDLGGVKTAAPIEYRCRGKPGKGSITEFSRKGIRVEKGSAPVEKGADVSIEFRIFSTANPLRILARGGETESPDHFVLYFADLDTAHKSMLSVVNKKLRERTGTPCSLALLADC